MRAVWVNGEWELVIGLLRRTLLHHHRLAHQAAAVLYLQRVAALGEGGKVQRTLGAGATGGEHPVMHKGTARAIRSRFFEAP